MQDLILALLREDERIMLAPNSAQVPALLPIKQNLFFIADRQGQSAPAGMAGEALAGAGSLQQGAGGGGGPGGHGLAGSVTGDGSMQHAGGHGDDANSSPQVKV